MKKAHITVNWGGQGVMGDKLYLCVKKTRKLNETNIRTDTICIFLGGENVPSVIFLHKSEGPLKKYTHISPDLMHFRSYTEDF